MRHRTSSVAVPLASVTVARASVITFVNSAPVFDWRPYAVQQPPGLYLDVTQPSSQSGAQTPASISWGRSSPTGSNDGVTHEMYFSPSVRWHARPAGSPSPCSRPGRTLTLYPPQDLPAGAVVGEGLSWQTQATLGWLRFSAGEHWIVGPAFTMGLELTMGDGAHYAFASFVLSTGTYGTQYEPTSWGYESLPNTPVTVPAPGAAALVAAGLLATHRRRRPTPAG